MFAALFGLAVAVLLFGVVFILPIVSFTRLQDVTRSLERLRARTDELEQTMRRIALAAGTAEPGAAGAPSPVRPAAVPVTVPPPSTTAPAAAIALPSAAVAGPITPLPPPADVTAVPAEISPAAAARESAGSVEAAMPAGAAEDTLETRIGGRWLLYIGTATLVLGIGFFVKYAFDNEWITEAGRVLLGAAIGLVMVAAGHRFARRGYALYGQILAGGGFAALYLSVFAAFSFYGLLDRPAAFGLMVLITAGVAGSAAILCSQGLAWFAVVGGFITPFLVGGREDAQVVLLSYDALLVAGTIVMAGRHKWPVLNLGAYALTAVTFVGWAGEHYTPAKWVSTEAFLTLFCAMFTWAAIRLRRSADDENAGITAFVLLTAPLAYHVASVANLQQQWLPLLVYLTLFSLAGVLASIRLDLAWLRLAVFAATVAPLAAWIGEHAGPGWRLAPSVVLAAVYAMNLVAMGERLSRGPGDWKRADIFLFHANALALFGGLYTIVNAFAPAWPPVIAIGLALWHGGLAWFIRSASAEAGLNSLAMAFAMTGFAIGLQFDDWWAIVGWSIESAAVLWVGLRARREWMRLGGAMLLAFSLYQLFMRGFFEVPAGLTVIVNARVGATLVLVAVCFALAAIHRRAGAYLRDLAAPEIATFWVGGNVLLILLVSTEIGFYWTLRETTDAAARLARMASLSVAWALYGTGLIVVGIVRRYAPIRYLAIALLAVTVCKVFLLDLSLLGGIYRIIGFVGLGLFLLLGAWLYQRYRNVILGSD